MTSLSDVSKTSTSSSPIHVISTGGKNLQRKIFISRRCFEKILSRNHLNPNYSPRNYVVIKANLTCPLTLYTIHSVIFDELGLDFLRDK